MLLAIAYYRHGGWRRGSLLVAIGEHEAKERACADPEPAGRLSPTG